MTTPLYVLITAARNEENYITDTIKSVISQTVLPVQWIIVSDASTDRTDEIVQEFAMRHPFIMLLRNESGPGRNFAAKARSITMGCRYIKAKKYDYIGNLDADVSFDSIYYESIIHKFQDDPRLGIAGGILFDRTGRKYLKQLSSTEWSVSGPIQMFRRQCYEQIGGYTPIRSGVDAVAEVMARMRGWSVRAFPEVAVLHHRETGSEGTGVIKRSFQSGQQNYRLGYHFLFFLGSCLSRSTQKPFVLGSMVAFFGYCWNWVVRRPLDVPEDFVKFIRAEQIGRLRTTLSFVSLSASHKRIRDRLAAFRKK